MKITITAENLPDYNLDVDEADIETMELVNHMPDDPTGLHCFELKVEFRRPSLEQN